MERDCCNCRFEHYEADEIPCIHCGMDTREYWQPKPKTNADRIRAMTDEELFVFAKKQIGCGFDFFPCGVVCDGKCESYSDEECKSKVMNWLQQLAEGETNEN